MLELNLKDAVPTDAYAFGMSETMGQRIKRLREARGWTQSYLANLTGVTVSAVSQWELDSTKNVKLEPFLALADALGTDPYYLVFGADRAAVGHQKRPQTAPGRREPKP
jgi:transcriptional regulator with XRE-family HTH domain